MEDDVDFDLNLKAQVSLLTKVIADSGDVPSTVGNPWSYETWDVLWLGHMGIELLPSSELTKYQDPYALPFGRLTSDFNNYYEQLRDTNASPRVIRGVAAMAVYGYAVTRSSARAIIQASKTGQHAFDDTIHILCKGGKLRCVAPVPQLFHHHHVSGASRIDVDIDDGIKQDLRWASSRHQYTYNIQWSARCNVAGVGEKLGDMRQCLPSRYDHKV